MSASRVSGSHRVLTITPSPRNAIRYCDTAFAAAAEPEADISAAMRGTAMDAIRATLPTRHHLELPLFESMPLDSTNGLGGSHSKGEPAAGVLEELIILGSGTSGWAALDRTNSDLVRY